MKRIAMTGLAIGLTTVLAGCGWGDRGRLEIAVSAADGAGSEQHAWSTPHGHSSLPPGHPPITRGQGVLPPGHPPVPEGSTCPGGGLAREPSGERFRDFRTEPSEIISI